MRQSSPYITFVNTIDLFKNIGEDMGRIDHNLFHEKILNEKYVLTYNLRVAALIWLIVTFQCALEVKGILSWLKQFYIEVPIHPSISPSGRPSIETPLDSVGLIPYLLHWQTSH